jgi:hypothetical protein
MGSTRIPPGPSQQQQQQQQERVLAARAALVGLLGAAQVLVASPGFQAVAHAAAVTSQYRTRAGQQHGRAATAGNDIVRVKALHPVSV